MSRCGCSNASGSVGVADTPTLDLSLIGGVISGAPILDPATGNLLKAVGAGLRVDCTDVRTCVGNNTPAVFYQTPDGNADFTHNIAAAINVWEQVTELPAVTIAQAGTYLLDWEGSCNATIPVDAPGVSNIRAEVSTSLYRNGAQVPFTETKGVLVSQGTPAAGMTIPSLQIHANSHGSRVVSCAAGDQFTLWAKRVSNTASAIYQVLSNDAGRSRITATRIGA